MSEHGRCTVPWLEPLAGALALDGEAVLAVVASTQGSAPREAGATMVIAHDGVRGSIGGGHLEFEALRIARDALATPTTEGAWIVRFPLAARLGQCCGGAVRLLLTAGLVSRRQRVGTVVIALPGDARYSHDVTSVRDLFQYAQDTELRLVYIGKLALTKAMAREFGVEPGEEWIYCMGIRHDDRAGLKQALPGVGAGQPLFAETARRKEKIADRVRWLHRGDHA